MRYPEDAADWGHLLLPMKARVDALVIPIGDHDMLGDLIEGCGIDKRTWTERDRWREAKEARAIGEAMRMAIDAMRIVVRPWPHPGGNQYSQGLDTLISTVEVHFEVEDWAGRMLEDGSQPLDGYLYSLFDYTANWLLGCGGFFQSWKTPKGRTGWGSEELEWEEENS